MQINPMLRAIELGEKGRISAPPNPWVGCVIVKEGEIVGEGFHESPGKPHAEIVALEQAGEKARGATVYVTLEPCIHWGRTPPCAEALIRAGVAEVIVALEDPDPKMQGQGIALLKEAGIKVSVGLEAEKTRNSLLPYLHHRTYGRPYCWVKAAVSVDGRIAAANGSSQWISTKEARQDVHQLRAQSQAIMIGAGTAIVDQPRLTVRDYPSQQQQPLRVVIDGKGTVPAKGPLFQTDIAPTTIITGQTTEKSRIAEWEDAGATVIQLSAQGGVVNLQEVLEYLGSQNILQLLVEGGSKLYGELLKQNLIDHLSIYVGPRILGQEGLSLFGDVHIPNIEQAPILQLCQSKVLGQSLRLDYRPS